jgi:hypothetical protein
MFVKYIINSLNAELNTICHLLALLRAHHILHVSRVRVKTLHVTVTIVWPSSGDRLSCLVPLILLLRLFASSSCWIGMWLYVVCNVMIALEWFHDFIYQDMKEMNHMTEKGWTYLRVCVSDVLVWGMFGCELSLIACGSCASSYNGFGSSTCCSVISRF